MSESCAERAKELVELVLDNEDILQQVFQAMGLKDRHSAAPLVCRRWSEVVHSPQLLRSLSIRLDCTDPRVLPAFCCWLRGRAAGHLRSLHLELRANGLAHALESEADAQLLFSSLEACAGCVNSGSCDSSSSNGSRSGLASRRGARQVLRELRLCVDSQLTVSPANLGQLCASLRCLHLDATSKSHESASTALYAFGLEKLMGVKELRLQGSAVELHRSDLPPSLKRLHLAGFRDLTSSMRHSLPRQLESLKQLHTLHLRGVYCNTPDCYRPLLCLLELRQLALTRCTHLPACLPRLTSLKVLCLDRAPLEGRSRAQELGAALSGLTQLTHLVLRGMSFGSPGVPAELAGLPAEVADPLSRLSQLSTFCWTFGSSRAWEGPRLPTGPWLSSLRRVALDAPLVASEEGQGWFAAAAAVEQLAVQGRFRSGTEQLAVAAAADKHPSLRRLAFAAADPLGWSKGRLEAELRRLQLRPGLHTECGCALLRELACLQDGAPAADADFAF